MAATRPLPISIRTQPFEVHESSEIYKATDLIMSVVMYAPPTYSARELKVDLPVWLGPGLWTQLACNEPSASTKTPWAVLAPSEVLAAAGPGQVWVRQMMSVTAWISVNLSMHLVPRSASLVCCHIQTINAAD